MEADIAIAARFTRQRGAVAGIVIAISYCELALVARKSVRAVATGIVVGLTGPMVDTKEDSFQGLCAGCWVGT